MKRRMIAIIVVALAVFSWVSMDNPTLADDGFYVVASGGGTKGRVLKTQIFNWGIDTTTGSVSWERLANPSNWIYTKISATSKLVIAYQDSAAVTLSGTGFSLYQIRVNDLYSDAGLNSNTIACSTSTVNSYSTTGIWSNLPQGEVTLSIWHRQYSCVACTRGSVVIGNVLVTEIEPY
jgi:hypothetical protein